MPVLRVWVDIGINPETRFLGKTGFLNSDIYAIATFVNIHLFSPNLTY
ncbi:MAG: hypothetical protein SXA11_02405 [Cyanobacteriota bacterium]|nr:hypothetical protein [Cyanobacteriota bacterium]